MIIVGAVLLAVVVLFAVFAPLFAGDPMALKPSERLLPPSASHWLGTDQLGRDVYARTIFGGRVSLLVGLAVAAVSIAGGLLIGLAAGYWRKLDRVVMCLMDGLMAIPAILLAIALVALNQGGILIIVIAISIPEIPRVVRLVRAVVLTVRDMPYVEASVAGGSGGLKIVLRHITPSTRAPLIVQGTYIIASAILIEAALSFLGAGVPADIPSWGGMIASGRLYVARAPWAIFAPGFLLAMTILAVNLLGDGLRDLLDVRLSRRM